jgi:hypothetical protein
MIYQVTISIVLSASLWRICVIGFTGHGNNMTM